MYARSQFNDQIKNGHCLAIGVHGLHGVHVLQIEQWKLICLNCLCNLLIHPCCHWFCVYYVNVLSSCTLSMSEVNKVFVYCLMKQKDNQKAKRVLGEAHVRIAQFLFLCVVFRRLLFDLLSVWFWPFYCISFVDLRLLIIHWHLQTVLALKWLQPSIHVLIRRVWRYQRGNQNPYIKEEQTTQWPKEKVQKDKQRSTKHTKLKIELHKPH